MKPITIRDLVEHLQSYENPSETVLAGYLPDGTKLHLLPEKPDLLSAQASFQLVLWLMSCGAFRYPWDIATIGRYWNSESLLCLFLKPIDAVRQLHELGVESEISTSPRLKRYLAESGAIRKEKAERTINGVRLQRMMAISVDALLQHPVHAPTARKLIDGFCK